MREIRTEIEITAPLTKVWSILTDFDNWAEWNPIVVQASGVASVGSKLNMTMRCGDDKAVNKYMPVVTNVEELKLFRWRATMMADFIFTNDKVFELEEIDSGTRLIHIEAFSGMLVSLFWGKMEKSIQPMLESMNNALKSKAEKNSV
jgi:hypothetical protein